MLPNTGRPAHSLRSPALAGEPQAVRRRESPSAWLAPNGQDLAAVRRVDGQSRLEYPIGKTIYETRGWISSPRISRGGDQIAFIDHPASGDDGGLVAVVDRSGKKVALTPPFGSAQGLAWSPDGSEVWFTAAEVGNRALYGVSLSGKLRSLAQVTGSLTIQDVSFRRTRAFDRRGAEVGHVRASSGRNKRAGTLLARLVAPRRPFPGRQDGSLLRIRRRRPRLLHVFARHGRLAGGPAGRGPSGRLFSGREVGRRATGQAHQPAPGSVSDRGGTAEARGAAGSPHRGWEPVPSG
jgi:hypothetical protein